MGFAYLNSDGTPIKRNEKTSSSLQVPVTEITNMGWSFVNNDSVTPVLGDIIRSSGQNYGAVLAQADSSAHSSGIIGVWDSTPGPGRTGAIKNNDTVEVNCTESVNPGDSLYLSAVTAGKATKTPPTYAVFIGNAIATRTVNDVVKATVFWALDENALTPAGSVAAQALASLPAGALVAQGPSGPQSASATDAQLAGLVYSPVANNFDPTVSGLARDIGSVVGTIDQTKAWKKWGANNTDWVALHVTRGSTSGSIKILSIPLYCETAGGFRLHFDNIQNDSAAYATNQSYIGPVINGEKIARDANISTNCISQAAVLTFDGYEFLAGGFAAWFSNIDLCSVTIECGNAALTSGARRVSMTSDWKIGSTKICIIRVDAIVPAGTRIDSFGIGIFSTGQAANMPPGVAWRCERLP